MFIPFFSMKETLGKGMSTLFLKAVVILIGIGALAFLLWEPHLEGRNVDATLFEMYFNDPFLAYVYIGSIPFFAALYQAFMLLGHIRQNKIFSQNSIKALRMMRYCATALVVFIIGAEAYIVIVQRGKDDIAGGVAMGLFMAFISVIIATSAAVCERIVQSAGVMKSEDDLTV
jgi:hypothetical protein